MDAVRHAPLVVDIRHHSLDDGPGIRSVVFFKGCPLRCAWCQNPEAMEVDAEVQLTPVSCIGCRACVDACPSGVARPASSAVLPAGPPCVAVHDDLPPGRQGRRPPRSSDGCTACGACVEACPAAARRIAGTPRSVDELVARLLRDAPFYRRSRGGVTLSGGEPTMFAEFAGLVAARLREKDVHVLVETCGHFAFDRVAEHLLPHVSTIFFDLKIADPSRHRLATGRDNARIHDNLRRLVSAGFPDILPRIPLVPSLTDDDDNLRALAGIVRGAGLRRVALLPYNPLWVPKRRALGLATTYAHGAFMSASEVARCRETVSAAGVDVA